MRQQNVVHLTKVITDWYKKAPAAIRSADSTRAPPHLTRRGPGLSTYRTDTAVDVPAQARRG